MRDLDEAMTFLLVAPLLLFLAVIGLNLFIALLSNTFQKVQDNACEHSLLLRVNFRCILLMCSSFVSVNESAYSLYC